MDFDIKRPKEDRSELAKIVKELQEDAVKNGKVMTMDEINDIVAQVRKERKERNK